MRRACLRASISGPEMPSPLVPAAFTDHGSGRLLQQTILAGTMSAMLLASESGVLELWILLRRGKKTCGTEQEEERGDDKVQGEGIRKDDIRRLVGRLTAATGGLTSDYCAGR